MITSARLSAIIVATLGLADFAVCQNITSDAHFYGQSPLVAPPATGTGTSGWAASYSKAAALVAQLTLEEKANLTMGTTASNGCSGNIQAIPRLGFPGLCLQDAGQGVRGSDFVSGFPSGLHVGASWNKDLTYQRALALGGEFHAKGVNVALGPVVGPLGRISEGGRNWEGFTNDPYLAGSLVYESVRGIQERGVMTSTKHYIGNEQETNRNPVIYGDGRVINSSSSNMDDKTMHELYLWPFADAVKAGTANIMCSYNRLNNSYGCQNSKSLNGLLKSELGFQGFVVSDWSAQHGGVASAESGLDMAMPDGKEFWGNGHLVQAVSNGSLSESRLDDMAIRILASWYQLGQDSPSQPVPGAGMPVDLRKPHAIVDARDPAARSTIFEGAVEGHVLLKNTGVLPLKSPKVISLFGYDAANPPVWNINNGDLASAGWLIGFASSNVSIVLPSFLNQPNPNIFPQRADYNIIAGGGSGGNTPTYISSPYEALSARTQEDGTALFWDFESENPTVAGASSACIVMTNAFASEGLDRSGLHDPFSDSLINNVADNCNNTIVVIHNAGVQLVDAFVDHPNVTAIIFAHLPGQDSGKALVSLLYGDSQFSGKLPYTVPKNESDFGAILHPAQPEGVYAYFPQDDFSEGVYIDYRAFDAKNITPRYEFGFGLSYTTFSYSDLKLSEVEGAITATYPVGPVLEGGQTDLWDVIYQVTADVTNTGAYDAAEVAQLYVSIPGGPIRQLRGFSKVGIEKGAKVTVSFDLLRRDLSEWDTNAQKWKLQTGSYKVWVGPSSRTLPLTGTITI